MQTPRSSLLSTSATALATTAAALLAGCGVEEAKTSEIRSAVSVQTYTTSSCTTSVVIGLSKQIGDEIGCMNPTLLTKFAPSTRLQITSNAVLPYLHANAKADLLKVAETKTVQVNSAFRSVVQQYLLYRWYQLGRCGITAAATPGRSNHESGRALDLANYSALISSMAARNWSHSVPGDPVHFDHLGSPDIRGKDVLAFQRLWNRNNPADKISEDGAYGPQTEARLKASPATGFATGATCAGAALVAGADVVMVEGPDRVEPGVKAKYQITVDNRTDMDWTAGARLRVAGGETSEMYDPATWASPSDVGEIGSDIGAGGQGIIEIEVKAPNVSQETPLFTQLELTEGGVTLGTINLALTVTPNGDHDVSTESADQNDDGIEVTGGCSTGGGASSWAALLLPALIALGRRRRARH